KRAQVAQQSFRSASQTERAAPGKGGIKSHMFGIGTSNRFDAVAITPFERRLFFLTAYRHLQAGCPSLALEVLSRLPANIMSYSEKSEIEECSRRLSMPDAVTAVGYMPEPESKPAKAEDLFSSSTNAFDWGGTSSTLFAPVSTEEFEIKFDDDDGE